MRLSDALLKLADADGDPDVFSVVVVYETREGEHHTLRIVPSGLRAFAEELGRIALDMAHEPLAGTH